jgi:predicted TIM-barrel fold metal-dependent hydrolase
VTAFRAGTAEIDYVATMRQIRAGQSAGADVAGTGKSAEERAAMISYTSMNATMNEMSQIHANCPGHDDPYARLKDMDSDGIAAEVIFAGGQNSEVLPFVGFGVDIGSQKVAAELRMAGYQIWNRWLADFVSVAPERLIGVMQVPIWDVGAAVRELEAGREAGLGAVNLPAPRSDFPAYNDEIYEPFWSACDELQIPLGTHTGGGETPLGCFGPGGGAILGMETSWLARRGLWEMIFGRVFERHPGLRYTLTEQRVVWVSNVLHDMDYINRIRTPSLPREPSEYFASNCYNAGSYMAPWEVERRHEVGIDNLLWGTDYPHIEGTWPHTRAALRHAFCDVPEDETRRILGESALRAYYLDPEPLRAIAARIGPTVDELKRPLEPEEVPGYGGAFRESGTFDAVPV